MAQVNYSSRDRYALTDEEQLAIIENNQRYEFLKDLHKKQTNTNVSLDSLQKQTKDFVKVNTETNLCQNTSGFLTLSQFCDIKEKYNSKNVGDFDCKVLNDTQNKIDFGLSGQETCDFENASSIDQELNIQKYEEVNVENIQSKIQDKIENKPLSQQLLSLEKNLMQSAYKNKPVELKSKPNTKELKVATVNPESFWDCLEVPNLIFSNKRKSIENNKEENNPVQKKKMETIVISKTEDTKQTDTTKPFVFITKPDQLISLDSIKCNKLTMDKIKNIDKFRNYEAGIESKTLYVKNLPNQTTPFEIASIFGHFESKDPEGSHINYQILKGRMRGQAFINFPNINAAKSALETFNGYILRGKPIIISYGKSKNV